MKNTHSNELEEFKKNYQQRIENLAKSKAEWIKDFVESQKPKNPIKTVGEMYKELKRKDFKAS
ncbi:uncharacterized protein CHSO_1065 [Chryseobacterium sp. StRB126]|uniref:hypothetical protein n=1 Tax=Chryseobacterium sp. StRB126 TaxID=878220 RepID=UPI0004E98F72|nr:hypothetical protein [Chryseobacterium sp. StRB126]BAP30102.1 uncharacterized protein CHSO_1065 [Chryseobacterium sp. StRB126]